MGKGILNRGTQVHQSKKVYTRLKVGKLYNCEDRMSGGHFGHFQNKLKEQVESMREEIRLNKPKFSEDTLELLEYIQFIMERTVDLMDEADWLFSGDITEESFVEGASDKRRKLLKGRPDGN